MAIPSDLDFQEVWRWFTSCLASPKDCSEKLDHQRLFLFEKYQPRPSVAAHPAPFPRLDLSWTVLHMIHTKTSCSAQLLSKDQRLTTSICTGHRQIHPGKPVSHRDFSVCSLLQLDGGGGVSLDPHLIMSPKFRAHSSMIPSHSNPIVILYHLSADKICTQIERWQLSTAFLDVALMLPRQDTQVAHLFSICCVLCWLSWHLFCPPQKNSSGCMSPQVPWLSSLCERQGWGTEPWRIYHSFWHIFISLKKPVIRCCLEEPHAVGSI